MIARMLLATGSLIYLLLGTIHLLYTFFSTKFTPREASVEGAMQGTSPRLTSETTMWKAWIGFNASHSTGALFFGLINLLFAIQFFTVFKESLILQSITLINSVFYLFLARRFWFRIPFTGILISTACYIIALLLIYLNP